MVCNYKGKNPNVPVYGADTALLAELRAIVRQAAEELGQWGRKSETGAFDSADMVRLLHDGRGRAGSPAGTQAEA